MNETTTTNGNYAAPHRTFTEAIKVCFAKYATFKGRASRTEFWWFWLFSYVLGQLSAIVSNTMDGALGIDWNIMDLVFYSVVFLMPTLAAGCRRLHDTGRSGWNQLFLLTIIGIPLVIYWWAQLGQTEINEFYEEG